MKINLSLIQKFALIGVAFIAFEVTLVTYADRPVANFVHNFEALHPAWVDFFRFYTDFAKGAWYLVPSGLGALVYFGLATGRRLSAAKRNKLLRVAQGLSFFFFCVLVSGLVTDIEKFLIGRGRPKLYFEQGFYGFNPFVYESIHNSMPSGHSTTAFAVAFALAAMFPRWIRYFLGFALVMVLSRIMVSAHFLADVAAGAFVGWLTVVCMHALFKRQKWYFVPPPVEPEPAKEADDVYSRSKR
jgi:membrane-associated phospholipid phosphatase